MVAASLIRVADRSPVGRKIVIFTMSWSIPPRPSIVWLLAHAGLVGTPGEDRLGALLRLLLLCHGVEIARRHVAELLEHVVREALARSLQLAFQFGIVGLHKGAHVLHAKARQL